MNSLAETSEFPYIWKTIYNEWISMTPVSLFKLLADDTRLRCLMLIQREEELCVCELTEALRISQPKISRHLAALRESALLTDRRQSTWVFYRLNEALPDWVTQVLHTTAEHNPELTLADQERLNTMGNRPERQQSCCVD
jgi:ArsR family transcriptional regulator